MGKPKKVTLTIDEEVIKIAHDIGLNISKVAENALKETISKLKGERCAE